MARGGARPGAPLRVGARRGPHLPPDLCRRRLFWLAEADDVGLLLAGARRRRRLISIGRPILEWHRRMEFRRSLFQQGCGSDPIYRTDYLLTTRDRAGFLEESCGPLVLETDRFALLRPAASGGSDAAQH